MTIKDYTPHLSKDKIQILIPYNYMQDEHLNELRLHLINYKFDVEIIPCDFQTFVCIINEDTDRRIEIVGALVYYKIKGLLYQFWIEQNNNTLFVNSNLFE